MRSRRMVGVLVVAMIVVLAYLSVVGWSQPVDDFEQPEGTIPTDWYDDPDNPFQEPNAWWEVTMKYTVVCEGFSTQLYPIVTVSGEVETSLYGGIFDETRVYQTERLNLLWWTPSFPDIPEYPDKFVVKIQVGSTSGESFTAYWNGTEEHPFTSTYSEVSGESGRVFIDHAGSFYAKVSVVCVSPTSFAGTIFGSYETTFSLVEPWGG